MTKDCIYVLLVVMFLLAVGCSDRPEMLPRSGGSPYEVLLVSDADSILYKALDVDMAGLPQPEPLFDVSTIDNSQFKDAARLSRAIVRLEVDSTIYTQSHVRFEKNVFARPQIVVYVTSPSKDELSSFMESQGGKMLSNLLVKAELNASVAALRQKHNVEAEQMVYEQFGIKMLIPADMLSSKKGKHFLWLSDNANSGMRNICVYSVAGHVDDPIAVRDSIMMVNIPGEHEGMFLQTVRESVFKEKAVTKDSVLSERDVFRGLWEMRGDAMGGPFVLHIIRVDDYTVFVEAFVYAPEMRKRNKLRQLEAILFSAKNETITEKKLSN